MLFHNQLFSKTFPTRKNLNLTAVEEFSSRKKVPSAIKKMIYLQQREKSPKHVHTIAEKCSVLTLFPIHTQFQAGELPAASFPARQTPNTLRKAGYCK